ncbi:MAG: hypothetical protein K0S31_4065 [Sphingobacterium multivorum]|jgi:hypothetical protein|nr:hypothetical protein [Sphingobacterium multivorum]
MKVRFLIPFLFFIIACQGNDEKQVPVKIQKQAFVSLDYVCGALCGQGYDFILEKINDYIYSKEFATLAKFRSV